MGDTMVEAEEAQADFLFLRQVGQGVNVRITEPLDIPKAESASNLLCLSNLRGLLFAATNEGFVVHRLKDVRHQFSSAAKNTTPTLPAWRTIATTSAADLGSRVTFIRMADRESRLAVGLANGRLAIYTVDDLVQDAAASASPNHILQPPSPDLDLIEVAANPSDRPELCAVLYAKKGQKDIHRASVAIFNLHSGQWQGEITVPGGASATCLAWSVRGKQIVLGLDNGELVQVTPEGEAKDRLQKAEGLEGSYYIEHVVWLENHVFVVTYNQPQTTEEPEHQYEVYGLLREPSKNNRITSVRFSDPAPPFGDTSRHGHRYVSWLRAWEPMRHMLFMANTSSTDVGMLGCSSQKTGPAAWQSLELEDTSRPALPFSTVDKGADTSPVGLEIDLTSKDRLDDPQASARGEDGKDKLDAAPVLLIYINDGVLLAYHIINTGPKAGRYAQMAPTNISIQSASPAGEATMAADVAEPERPTPPAAPDVEQKSTASAFGLGNTTPSFGQPAQIGAAKASPFSAFPTSTASTSSAGGFGAFAAKAGTTGFGSSLGATSSGFGGATSPANSSPAPAPVQTTPITSAFGASSSPGPTFGASSSFGAAAPSAPTFGQSSAFGQSTGFGQPSSFGSSSGTAFGGKGATGSATQPVPASAFGSFASKPLSFGSSAPSAAAASGSVFGSGGTFAASGGPIFGQSASTSKPASDKAVSAKPSFSFGANGGVGEQDKGDEKETKAEAGALSFGGMDSLLDDSTTESDGRITEIAPSSPRPSSATPAVPKEGNEGPPASAKSSFGASATASPSSFSIGSPAPKDARSTPLTFSFGSPPAADKAGQEDSKEVAKATSDSPPALSESPSVTSKEEDNKGNSKVVEDSKLASTLPTPPASKSDETEPAKDTNQAPSFSFAATADKAATTSKPFSFSPQKDVKNGHDTESDAKPSVSPPASGVFSFGALKGQQDGGASKGVDGSTSTPQAKSASSYGPSSTNTEITKPGFTFPVPAKSPFSFGNIAPAPDEARKEEMVASSEKDAGSTTPTASPVKPSAATPAVKQEPTSPEPLGSPSTEELSQQESSLSAPQEINIPDDDAPKPLQATPTFSAFTPQSASTASKGSSFLNFTNRAPRSSSPLSGTPVNREDLSFSPEKGGLFGNKQRTSDYSFTAMGSQQPANAFSMTPAQNNTSLSQKQTFSFGNTTSSQQAGASKSTSTPLFPGFSNASNTSATSKPIELARPAFGTPAAAQANTTSQVPNVPKTKEKLPPPALAVPLTTVRNADFPLQAPPKLTYSTTDSPDPQGVEGQGLQDIFLRTYLTMEKELEILQGNVERCAKFQSRLRNPTNSPLDVRDLSDPSVWTFAELETKDKIMQKLMEKVEELDAQSQAGKMRVREVKSEQLKVESKREEIARFLRARRDPTFRKMVKVRQLGPEHAENQARLRKGYAMLQQNSDDLDAHLSRLREGLLNERLGNPRQLQPPSLDAIRRAVRNISRSAEAKLLELEELELSFEALFNTRADNDARSLAGFQSLSLADRERSFEDGDFPTLDSIDDTLPMLSSIGKDTRAQKAYQANQRAKDLQTTFLKARKEPVLNVRVRKTLDCSDRQNGRSFEASDLTMAFASGPIHVTDDRQARVAAAAAAEKEVAQAAARMSTQSAPVVPTTTVAAVQPPYAYSSVSFKPTPVNASSAYGSAPMLNFNATLPPTAFDLPPESAPFAPGSSGSLTQPIRSHHAPKSSGKRNAAVALPTVLDTNTPTIKSDFFATPPVPRSESKSAFNFVSSQPFSFSASKGQNGGALQAQNAGQSTLSFNNATGNTSTGPGRTGQGTWDTPASFTTFKGLQEMKPANFDNNKANASPVVQQQNGSDIDIEAEESEGDGGEEEEDDEEEEGGDEYEDENDDDYYDDEEDDEEEDDEGLSAVDEGEEEDE